MSQPRLDHWQYWGCTWSVSLSSSQYLTSSLYFSPFQLLALAEIVISSLKIDSGSYGEIKAGFEMPGECNTTDNNNTWWCKVIRNDDNSEYHQPQLTTKYSWIFLQWRGTHLSLKYVSASSCWSPPSLDSSESLTVRRSDEI